MVDMTKLGDFGAKQRVPTNAGTDPRSGMSGLSNPDVSIQPTLGTTPVGSGQYGNDWNYASGQMPSGGYQMNGTESLGYGLNNSGFLFPSGIDQSAAAVARLGRQKIQTPGAWTTGLEALNPMSQTGMPTSADEWWAATQDVTNRNITDAIKNAAEQAGLGGLRWSTPLGQTAQDISGKYMGEASQQWADRAMQAQEAARQRQLEATGQLYQYGQGQYQMQQDEFKRRMMAAQAAGNADRYKTDLALRVLPMIFGMGNTAQDSEQQAINASYNNPYMNYANQFLGNQPNMQPQTYQPSAFTNALGTLGAGGGIGGLSGLFGGGGGAGSALGSMPDPASMASLANNASFIPGLF